MTKTCAPAAAGSPRLRYDEPVLLVGGGWFGWDAFEAARRRAAVLIGVDGGADHFAPPQAPPAAPTPVAVLGDLDSARSLSHWRAHPECVVERLADQDRTDFEKSLDAVAAPLTLGLGFLGRRLDHALAACAALLKRPDRRIVLIGEEDVVFLCPPVWRARLGGGARLSFLPLEPCRAEASQGLRWPLAGLMLAPSGLSGVSNETTAETVSVRFEAPRVLAAAPREAFDAVIDSLTPPSPAAE